MTARAKILEAITGGKLLRVQTTRKCVLLRPFQAGTVGGRWGFDAVVIYAHRQEIETFYEPEIIVVHRHVDANNQAVKTLEMLAQRFDPDSATRWEFP